MARRAVFDHWLFFTTGCLILTGFVMVGSASYYAAMSFDKAPYHFLIKHAAHLAVGMGVLAACLYVSYTGFRDVRLVYLLVGLALVLLTVVLLLPPIGGVHRWIRFGPLVVQPSEFAKIAALIFVARLLADKEQQVNDPWVVPLPALGVVGAMAFLVTIEPDLGSAVTLAGTVGIMLFVAGLRWSYVAATAGLGAVSFVVGVIVEPYRIRRILSFLNPEVDPLGDGFQLTQSLIAIGSGGFHGVGLGQGQQKAYYLPAPHTDFIYSVVGEEVGLIGTTLLLAAFLLVLWRGMRTALNSPDRLAFYLAIGTTTLLVLQGLIHIGVCVGMLPTKGLPLPFVSYGGSSLLASMVAMGILLNVSKHAN